MNALDLTPGTQNYAAWQVRPLNELPMTYEAFLKHLVAWAILAASTHNTQPWRFIIEPRARTVHFCIDSNWVLPASDKIGRQAMISMGCALENFLCAADYYGAPCKVDYPLAMEGYPLPLITVRVEKPSNGAHHDLRTMEAMRKRRMNRKRFDPTRKVPPHVIEEMRKMANQLGLAVDIITDWPTRITMANVQYGADQVVIAMTKFRNELGMFFLPNNTPDNRGMPGATYGLDDEMSRRIHDELLKKGAFDAYLAEAFPAGDREALKTAPLIFVISIPEDTPHFWVTAGRMLERTALIAEIEGLGFSIHAAMVEESVSNTTLKFRLRRSERPTVIGRLGYSQESLPPHAPRANLEEVCEIRQ